jgi:hypothetical protein
MKTSLCLAATFGFDATNLRQLLSSRQVARMTFSMDESDNQASAAIGLVRPASAGTITGLVSRVARQSLD